MELMEDDFYCSKAMDGVVRQNRIKELAVLTDKYMAELEVLSAKTSALEREIQILNERLKAYRTIEDGYRALYDTANGQLKRLDPDSKVRGELLRGEMYRAQIEGVGHQEH